MIKDVRLGATQAKALYIGETLLWERPSALAQCFENGQQGVLYAPWDISTLYQDTAMTIPVTTSGDPVRVMLDTSGNGNHAVAPSISARPIYRTDGQLHWLEGDGVDDYFDSINLVPWNGSTFYQSSAIAITGGQQYGGPFRFLRSGGGATALSDNYFEEYSNSPWIRKVAAQRYPSLVALYASETARPNLNTNQVSWQSNNTTAKSQVMPYQTAPINSGTKTFSAGNATLSLFRGYRGDLMKGRMYGFIWVSDSVSDANRDKANAYLAAKAGVTL